MSINAPEPNHYQTLGLQRGASRAEIRDAYRQLAKRYHPDANPDSNDDGIAIKQLNTAYETLSDPIRRRAYDRELDKASRAASPGGSARRTHNISEEIRIRIEDFLRGTSVDVKVNDPGNPEGPETYRLAIPPGTAPGARFRIPRSGPFAGGFVDLRVKALPGFRFKVRGSDLRCELRLDTRRASQGGMETMEGPGGEFLRIEIPAGVKRGQILRLAGKGMPKPRGGRGDLLVRVSYRPEVRVSRSR